MVNEFTPTVAPQEAQYTFPLKHRFRELAGRHQESRAGVWSDIPYTTPTERGHYNSDNGRLAFVDTYGNRNVALYDEVLVAALEAAGYTSGRVYVPSSETRKVY